MSRSGQSNNLDDITNLRDFNQLINHINNLIYTSKYPQAVEIIQTSLENPLDIDQVIKLESMLSHTLLGIGQYKNAMERADNLLRNYELDLNEEVCCGKEISEVYLTKAHALMYLGRLNEALEAAENATKYDNNSIKAYSFMGYTLKHLHKDDQAYDALHSGVEIVKSGTTHGQRDIELDLSKSLLARYCAKYDHAIKYANYVIEQFPEYSVGYTYMGIAYLFKAIKTKKEEGSREIISKSIEAFEKAIELNPDNCLSLYYNGLAHEATNDKERAMELYEAAINNSPEYSNAVLALVNLKIAEGSDEKALEIIDEFLNNNPNSEDVLLSKTKILTNFGELEEAEECCNKLILLSPDNHHYHYKKSLIQYNKGEYAEAIASARNSIELDEGATDAYYHLAMIHIALKDYDSAVTEIEELLALNPMNASAHQALGYLYTQISTDEDLAFKCFYKYDSTNSSISLVNHLMNNNEVSRAKIAYYNNISHDSEVALYLFEEAELLYNQLIFNNGQISSRDDLGSSVRGGAGDVYYDTNTQMLEDALASYEEVLQKHPDFPLAIIRVTDILQKLSRNQEAQEILDNISDDLAFQVHKLQNNDFEHIEQIRKKALDSHEMAIKIEPSNPLFYSSMASTYAHFDMINEMIEYTYKAQKLLENGAGESLEPHQREFIENQNHIKIELFSRIQLLIEEADELVDKSQYRDGIYDVETVQDLNDVVTNGFYNTAQRGEGDNLAKLRDVTAREIPISITPSVFGSPLMPQLTEEGIDRFSARKTVAAHKSGTFLGTSAREFMMNEDEANTLSSVNQSAECIEFKNTVLEFAKDSIKRVGSKQSCDISIMQHLMIQLDELNAKYEEIKEENREIKEHNANIEARMNGVQDDVDAVREGYEEVQEDVNWIKKNSLPVEQLMQIEQNAIFQQYYHGFVSTFQKSFVGFMARDSGSVKASEFSLPKGIQILPLPSIIDSALKVFEASIATIEKTKENNKIKLALQGSPDIIQLIGTIVPKVAAKIILKLKTDDIISYTPTESANSLFGINSAYQFIKDSIFEQDFLSSHNLLGSEDAMKLIAAFRSGIVRITTFSDADRISDDLANLFMSEEFKEPLNISNDQLNSGILGNENNIDPGRILSFFPTSEQDIIDSFQKFCWYKPWTWCSPSDISETIDFDEAIQTSPALIGEELLVDS